MVGCQSPAETRIRPIEREQGIQKVACVIEYDGTNFYGFQRQPKQRTVQAELEQVLGQIAQRACSVVGAGRTDRGVHARSQVIHFCIEWKHPWLALRRALNALLPMDISVREVLPVGDEFHARYSATSRLYRYVLYNGEVRSAFAARFAHQVTSCLDVHTMNRASGYLIGTHDYASFGQAPNGGHTVRQVYGAHWWRQGDWVFFDIEANAFLRQMVRSIVGTLLLVGVGKLSPAEVADILAARNRASAGPPAPAQGLFLEKICYPAPWRHIGC